MTEAARGRQIVAQRPQPPGGNVSQLQPASLCHPLERLDAFLDISGVNQRSPAPLASSVVLVLELHQRSQGLRAYPNLLHCLPQPGPTSARSFTARPGPDNQHLYKIGQALEKPAWALSKGRIRTRRIIPLESGHRD